ncbi:MAG: hypothetical protein JW981_01725 [Anaerolineae bacterium]|nr:hypothetical protein [Anaerolineae bacterium]
MDIITTRNIPQGMDAVIDAIAQELQLSEEILVKQALHALIQQYIREINAKILQITGHYDVTSVAEMEARYETGDLEEADSWRDLQQLDHLEYKRDRLSEILETLA